MDNVTPNTYLPAFIYNRIFLVPKGYRWVFVSKDGNIFCSKFKPTLNQENQEWEVKAPKSGIHPSHHLGTCTLLTQEEYLSSLSQIDYL